MLAAHFQTFPRSLDPLDGGKIVGDRKSLKMHVETHAIDRATRNTIISDRPQVICQATAMNRAPIDCWTLFKRIDLGAHPIALPNAVMLAFESATFDEDDFRRHGVARPMSIVRSVPKRQAEYLAGRRAALAALRDIGSDATDLPIGANRAPCWPPGYIGSISHAAQIAVAIATSATAGVTGVGIDIEHIGTTAQTEAIRAIALDAREQTVLAPLAAARSWPYALTLAFSAKESFYKATAATVGYFFDFNALRIDGCDPTARCLNTRIAHALAPTLPGGQHHVIRWTNPTPETLLTSCVW